MPMPHRILILGLLLSAASCAAAEDAPATPARHPGPGGGDRAPVSAEPDAGAPPGVDASPGAVPLELLRRIPLPGVRGRIDHLALDRRRRRLGVAALGNGTFEIVSLDEGRRERRMDGLAEPQGVEFVPGGTPGDDRWAVACGGDGAVRLYDAETLEPSGVVELGGDADNAHRDASGRLYVAYGDGGLAQVDAIASSVRGRAELPVHPEGFVVDDATRRAYVNLAAIGAVAVLDLDGMSVTATWRLGDVRANFPMALDASRERIYTGCRSPTRLVILSSVDGARVGAADLAGDPDDVFVDPVADRVYVSCRRGTIDVFDVTPGGVRLARRIDTIAGARTALLDVDGRRFYLAVPARSGAEAEIREYVLR